MKISIDDFIYEVKEEITCYEDLGQEKADEWEAGFRKWLSSKKSNKKNIIDEKYYKLSDESEIFSIVDLFLDAVEFGKEKEYWEKFK